MGPPSRTARRGVLLSNPIPVLQPHHSPFSGSFGTVFAGTRRKDGRPVAIKVIPRAALASPTAAVEARTEAEALALCAGDGVVALLDWGEDARSAFFVLERCAGGELFDVIADGGPLPEPDAAAAFAAALRAVARCHQLGVVHRDIKPENFLLAWPVGGEGGGGGGGGASPAAPPTPPTPFPPRLVAPALRLTDFGLATYAPGPADPPLAELVGSTPYVAPEVLRRAYSTPADIWACGVVLYITLSGLPPFWGRDDRAVMDAILAGAIDVSSPPWDAVSAGAKDLVLKLLDRDPATRPTAADALAHPWVVGHHPHPARAGGGEAGAPAAACAAAAPPPSPGATPSALDPVVLTRVAGFGAANALRRATLLHAAGRLPPTRTAGLRKLFAALDADGDGRVSPAELVAGLARAGGLRAGDEAGRAAAEAAAAEAVCAAAYNGGEAGGGGDSPSSATSTTTCGLSAGAFVAAAAEPGALTADDELALTFAAFDADGSGRLCPGEVAAALASMGLGSGRLDEAAALVAAGDQNDDGQLGWEEFRDLVRQHGRARGGRG